MFRRGKVLKVKVELSPEVVGFGRATIVDSDGGRLFLQLRTSKGEKRTLPKGTRVWFVSDSPDNPFNGLWSTTIVSSRQIHGKTALECTRPKFEAVLQRRRARRISASIPVRLQGEKYEKYRAATRNLSRSGVGIEVYDDCVDDFSSGHYIDIVIDSASGAIESRARVIQSRFNWLANRTDVGLEFIDISEEARAVLERLFMSLGGQPRPAPEGKDKQAAPAGRLSTWLKTTKDNVSFIKTAELTGTSVLSEEDLEDLEAEDDDVIDDDEHDPD
jgi:c-di-GMP-binding flagellar brake protein YcgR